MVQHLVTLTKILVSFDNMYLGKNYVPADDIMIIDDYNPDVRKITHR